MMGWHYFREMMIRYEDGTFNGDGFSCKHNPIHGFGRTLCLSCVQWLQQNRELVEKEIKK